MTTAKLLRFALLCASTLLTALPGWAQGCNANTPVANDACIQLQQRANLTCGGMRYMDDRWVLVQSEQAVHLRCLQFGGNGACLQAEYACTHVYSDKRNGERRRVTNYIGSGVRG